MKENQILVSRKCLGLAALSVRRTKWDSQTPQRNYEENVCCLRWMSLCACDTTRTATEQPSSRGEQHEKEKKIWRPLRHEENRAEIQNRDRAAAGISTEQITGCYTYCAMRNQTSERTTPAADQAHATRKIFVLDKMKDSPTDKLCG
jgi:hypothetical protein